ncbi:MAG: hypothetical protein HFH31_02185 [Bacilli bacterium]|nr:hypothetical protein [Bacilli bacterium]
MPDENGNYAALTTALLKRLFIKSYLISSNNTRVATHMWNLVNLDGIYYYADVTWLDDREDKFANDIRNENNNLKSKYSWYLVKPSELNDLDSSLHIVDESTLPDDFRQILFGN